jgi:hypothetical protein
MAFSGDVLEALRARRSVELLRRYVRRGVEAVKPWTVLLVVAAVAILGVWAFLRLP